MRPNMIGWFIVSFFLIGGVMLWIAMPEVGIGQIWTAVSLGLAAFYLWMNRRADQAQAIIDSGVRGTAIILSAEQTGMYVNEQPRVKLRLRIESPYSQFEDERTETVPLISLGLFSSGRPLTVYMDPKRPNDYVIDWSVLG